MITHKRTGQTPTRVICSIAVALCLATAPVLGGHCYTLDCCMETYLDDIADCNLAFPKAHNPADQELRNLGIRMCWDTAGNLAGLCGACVIDPDCPKDPPDPPPDPDPDPEPELVFALNGGNLIYTSSPVGSDPSSFTYNTYVLPALAGSFEIWVANGTPDNGTVVGIGRTVGSIKVNGVVVVAATILNESNNLIKLPVTLVAGQNTIEVSINQAVTPAQNPDEPTFAMIKAQFVK